MKLFVGKIKNYALHFLSSVPTFEIVDSYWNVWILLRHSSGFGYRKLNWKSLISSYGHVGVDGLISELLRNLTFCLH